MLSNRNYLVSFEDPSAVLRVQFELVVFLVGHPAHGKIPLHGEEVGGPQFHYASLSSKQMGKGTTNGIPGVTLSPYSLFKGVGIWTGGFWLPPSAGKEGSAVVQPVWKLF